MSVTRSAGQIIRRSIDEIARDEITRGRVEFTLRYIKFKALSKRNPARISVQCRNSQSNPVAFRSFRFDCDHPVDALATVTRLKA